LLIDNVNLLKDLLNTSKPSRQKMKLAVLLVDYLEAYATIHFEHEERCMVAYRCPVHALARQEHERFRQFIHDYKRLCEIQGFRVELLRNLHKVMRTWITEHLLKVDTQLKCYIQEQ
jgi:hemerythrin-like metal-binding protein